MLNEMIESSLKYKTYRKLNIINDGYRPYYKSALMGLAQLKI